MYKWMISWKAQQRHSDLTHLSICMCSLIQIWCLWCRLMSLLGLDRHEVSSFHFGRIIPEIQLRLVLHEWVLVTGVQFRSSAWPVRPFYSSWDLWVIFASINHEGRTSFWSIWRWMSALSLASGQEWIPALAKGTFNSSRRFVTPSLSLSDSCAAQRFWTGWKIHRDRRNGAHILDRWRFPFFERFWTKLSYCGRCSCLWQ